MKRYLHSTIGAGCMSVIVLLYFFVTSISVTTTSASTFVLTPTVGTAEITFPLNGIYSTNAYQAIYGTGSDDGAIITLTLSGTSTIIGTGVVSLGVWSIAPTVSLGEGDQTLCISGGSCVSFIIDTTRPAVTINQKIGQLDPTIDTSALGFTAIFSEPINVATFMTGSISTLGSTAPGVMIDSITEVSPYDGTTFDLSVSTSGLGTINLTIPLATTYGSLTLGTTGSYPYSGITIDSLGNVYTLNTNSNNVSKITPDGTSTILGPTGSNPSDIAIDTVGNIYVTNFGDSNVSKITPDGTSTILGPTGSVPRGITIDSLGNIYTANAGSNDVSKITPDGTSTILGPTGSLPTAITIDGSGNLYVANYNDSNVSKITPDGTSTILGPTGLFPKAIVIDAIGNIYTANSGNHDISKITPDGTSSIFATIMVSGESDMAITIDGSGNLYVAEYSTHDITQITPDGTTTILANNKSGPLKICVDAMGNIYTSSDADNVSKFFPNGILDLAGNSHFASTSTDNMITIISDAPMVTLSGSASVSIDQGSVYIDAGASWIDNIDGAGNTMNGTYGDIGSFQSSGTVDTTTLGIYSIDYQKVDMVGNMSPIVTRTIMVVDPGPSVTINQKIGQSDPTITGSLVFTAIFSEPISKTTFTTGSISTVGSTASGIVITSIMETTPNNGTTFDISVSASGLGTVILSIQSGSIISSILGTTGSAPQGIAMDASGNIYTANAGSNDVSKITPDGISTIFATTGGYPVAIITDSSGNIYTANYNDSNVSRITPDGTSTILGTTGPYPYGIAMDASGNIYTPNWGSDDVSRITPDGTSMILGITGSNPSAITLDSSGNVYTANIGSNDVSKITPDGTSTIFGTTGSGPEGIVIDSSGNIYTSNVSGDTVSKITPDGTSTIFGTTGSYPYRIAIDASGNIYTGNAQSDSISMITPSGVSTIIGITGANPNSILVDTIGNIYTANSNSNNVSRISRNGILDLASNPNKQSISVDNSITIISDKKVSIPVHIGGGGNSIPDSGISVRNDSIKFNNSLTIGISKKFINTFPILNNQNGILLHSATEIAPISILSTQSHVVPISVNSDNQMIFELKDRVTEYICPKILQVYLESEIQSTDIPTENFTDDIKSVIMFRGLKADESKISQTFLDYKQSGIVLNDEKYDPYNNITRAEFVKMLVKSLSCRYDFIGVDSGFSDVDSGLWYAEFITFASKNGWISGYKDSTFHPNSPISRGEVAKILANAIRLKSSVKGVSSFIDVDIKNEFSPYIEALKEDNILIGKPDSKYDADAYISRGEVSQLIYKTFLGGERK